ncbi:MAG: ABC transporter permease [Chloroflexi bacterium]|nr:ABC transporter permease [Chloroflexota bacterium]
MKQRVVVYLFTLWVVVTLNFLLPRLLPGDPLAALLDPQSADYVYNPDVRAELEAYYGLDRPLRQQYADYFFGAFEGDLGQSIRLNQPVTDLLGEHLPWTLRLTVIALALASMIGVWSGAEAAWKRRSIWDKTLVTVSVITSNAPVFFTGMLLLIVFGVELGWLPLAGGRTPFVEYATPWDKVRDYGEHLALPVITLTLALLGSKFLLVRNSMIGVLGEDYMLVARAKGLTTGRLKRRHALRNAILPFVHHLAAHTSFALTGALFIETLYNYPGMGKLIFDSVVARDYPVIQGVFLVVSVLVLSANLLADWLTLRLDPRVREA